MPINLSLPTEIVEELLRVQGEELLRVQNEFKASKERMISELDALRKENEELRSRVIELENKMKDAQTIFDLPEASEEELSDERNTTKEEEEEIDNHIANLNSEVEVDQVSVEVHDPVSQTISLKEESVESEPSYNTCPEPENRNNFQEDVDDTSPVVITDGPHDTDSRILDIDTLARMYLQPFCSRQSPYNHIKRFRKLSSHQTFIPGDDFIININERHEGVLVCPVHKQSKRDLLKEHKLFRKFARKVWRGELILRRGGDWVYPGTYETSIHVTILSMSEFSLLPKKTKETVYTRVAQGAPPTPLESIAAEIASGKYQIAKIKFSLVGYDPTVQEGLLRAASA